MRNKDLTHIKHKYKVDVILPMYNYISGMNKPLKE